MTKHSTTTYQNLIIFLLSILPVIDSINGYLTYEGKITIGTVYKLFIVIVLFFSLLQSGQISTKKFAKLLAFILFIFISVILNIFMDTKANIKTDCIVKLIFNVLMFIFLYENIRCRIINNLALYRIFNYNTVLMIVCIAVPYFLNIGYSSYIGELGFKGFYYSLNELNAVQIILFYFCLYKLLYQTTWKSFLQTVGIFFCVLLTNTKSSMIACVLGLILWFICYFKRNKNIYVFISIIIVALLLGGFALSQFSAFMQRQEFLYNTYGGDIIATLTSGRIYYLSNAWGNLISGNGSFIQLILGNGFSTYHLIEMDLLDMFFFLGIIGVIVLLVFVNWLLRRSKINFKKDKSALRKFEFYIILAFSFFTGHIIFMAMAGSYFVMLCCFNLTFSIKDYKNVNETNIKALSVCCNT